jgi:predicted RND superfamily exporter protein
MINCRYSSNSLVFKHLATLAVFAFMTIQYMSGQTSASLSSNATATIVTGLRIQTINDLNFGIIIRGKNNAKVRVKSDDTYDELDDAHEISKHWSRAKFLVTGQPNLSFSIFLPQNTITVENKDDVMELDEIELDEKNLPTLDHNGNKTIYVGGTLHLKGNQKEGSYTGSIAISVAY